MTSSSERRKGFWDEVEEEEEGGPSKSSPQAPDSQAINQKIHEATVLLEQTHQLYLQYLNGVERRPPAEKAQLLESMVNEIQRSAPQVTSSRFRVNQFVQHYQTMKELWARKLRDKERS